MVITHRVPLLLLAIVVTADPPRVVAQRDADPTVDASLYQDLKWRNVGPHRGGRVTAIAGVRQQPCTFYMGATGGGVWKTETCGNIWTPVSDGQIATGSIGSIDVSESNPSVVYVGTGSAAIRSNVIIGRGAYKSTDAGKTWQFLGLKESGQIGEVRVHPSNPDVAWLAALGSPFGPNAERGIFKTTDGGRTWKKTLFVDDEHGGRTVAVDKNDPNVLYAAMYRGFRKGWDIISGGPADKGGIYKSTDAGETWTKLSSGLPSRLIGKIDIDIARSNSKVVYAMVEAPRDEGGLYRSDDAGATWRLVNNSQRLRARPFYFHYVDVNPKNENEVWVNELGLHKSTDGGKTFTPVETPHGDNMGMWFNPDNPDYIIQSNDGGANVSVDHGRSWSTILNQPTAELYMAAVDNQTPYWLYAPQQDNSTIAVPSVPPVAWGFDHAAMSWMQFSGCETGQVSPTPDGKILWGVCKGEVGRYNRETGQEQHYWIYPQNRYGHDPDEIRERFPRQSFVYVSPHDPKTVYHGGHRVYRTTDDGVTWTRLSDDLTAREPHYQIIPGNPITRDITGEEVYSSLYAFTEARNEKGVLWAGANDGPVHVSRDAGKTWTNVTPKDLIGARIQNIEDSPHRKGSAYIAAYRFLREHDLQPYVYTTSDYGRTWTKLTDGRNGIPIDHPVRVVREDPEREGLLYAGTEFGFFVSFNNGRNWQALQQNLPATPVADIRVHRGDLIIATMGRSFWIMDDITPLRRIGSRDVTMTAAGGHLLGRRDPGAPHTRAIPLFDRRRHRGRHARRLHRSAVPTRVAGDRLLPARHRTGGSQAGDHRRERPRGADRAACRSAERGAGRRHAWSASRRRWRERVDDESGAQPVPLGLSLGDGGRNAADGGPGQIHGEADRRRCGENRRVRGRRRSARVEGQHHGRGPRRAAELPAEGQCRDRRRAASLHEDGAGVDEGRAEAAARTRPGGGRRHGEVSASGAGRLGAHRGRGRSVSKTCADQSAPEHRPHAESGGSEGREGCVRAIRGSREGARGAEGGGRQDRRSGDQSPVA